MSPRRQDESRYRVYTDEDAVLLQQILALRFLGFELREIRACLEGDPSRFRDALRRQKRMMMAKRRQIDAVLVAIDKAESAMRDGRPRGESMIEVIRAMQMDEKSRWVDEYFTPEQRDRMEQLQRESYSDVAMKTLRERQQSQEWTQEDQIRAQEQWAHVAAEADRLAAAGADPAGPEARAVAMLKRDLLSAFTMGDPEVTAGLNRLWERINDLPESEKPFDTTPFTPGSEGQALLNRAMEILEASDTSSHPDE